MIATTDNIAGSKTNSAPQSPSASARSTKRIRVWLTDDNAGFRELLEQLLVRSGEFNCELQFHSAEALLEGLASEPAPDVILLDVEMGGMTGVDALRPIRLLAPTVRVLVVTSFWDPMYEAQAVRDGASAFLIKANAPITLVGEIHKVLAGPIRMSPLAPVGISAAPKREDSLASSQPAIPAERKSFVSRLGSWATHLSSNLLRTTPVSTAGSHT